MHYLTHFTNRVLFLLTLLAACVAPPESVASTRGVTFQNTIALTAHQGTPFDQDLTLLLIDPGTPPYKFTSTNLPSWLSINGNHLVGTPPSTGKTNFHLTVKDIHPEGGDLNHPASINVLPPPPQFKTQDIDLGTQTEDSAWNDNLKNYLVDSSLANSFSATGLPAWMSLNTQTGALSGIPRRVDVGNYAGINFQAQGLGGQGSAAGHGLVLKTIHPPFWTQNPILFPDTLEDQTFTGNTIASLTKGDGVNFTFTLANAPNWISVNSSTGVISGTPHTFGPVLFDLTFNTTIDGGNYTGTTQVKFNVIHVNHAPKWATNPITLPDAFTSVGFNQNLAGQASDPDAGDTLHYSITGPGWATLDPNTGIFSGTPAKTNLGLNTWQATVTDPSGASDTTTIKVTVIKSNEPPTWTNHPTILSEAKEDFVYTVSLANHASDPDNDPLFFTMLSGPVWASIDSNGNLVGTPKAGDVGLSKFTILVSDHKALPDDSSEVQVLVAHTNHAPTWSLNPIPLQTDEDVLFSSNLSGYAQDVDTGDILSFSLVSGPSWATLSGLGVLSGTAHLENEGLNEFVVRVSDPSGASADTLVTINVLHVNHAPYWTQNPIVLPHAKDDSAYTASVASYGKDPDPGDILHFVKVSTTPDWVKISNSGEVTGSPTPSNVGLNSFQVKVVDAANAEALVTVQITVDHVNHPPKWAANPISLPSAFTSVSFIQNLSAQASDPDVGDTLSFSMTGPAWAKIDPQTGIFSGTPTKADIGAHSWQATVTDSLGGSDTTTIQVTVIKSNEPPTWTNHPTILGEAKEDFAFNAALPNHASDPDSDPLFFTILQGPAWATLDANGNLTGTPKAADVGLNKLSIRVSDHKSTPDDISEVQILVAHTNHAPTWAMDPITLSTNEDVLFTADLSTYASDVDAGDKLSFSLVSGPSWATLSALGILTGTAHLDNEGPNNFVVRVSDPSAATADTHVIVNVLHVNHAPYWTQNPIVLPNAKDDSPYSASVASYAKDPDPGDSLHFVKVSSTPSWVQFSNSGDISGSPAPKDGGLNSFQVKVVDASNAEALVTIHITVDHVNHPPKWAANPIPLPNAFTSVAFNQNLSNQASDPDAGDTLSFTLTGPSWAKLDPNTGVFSGTPAKADIGNQTWQATVTDSFGASDTTTIQVTVIKSNEPPTWTNHPTILGDAQEDGSYSAALSGYASDPDSDPLFFTLINGPAWATIDSNGNLIGSPKAANLGLNKFTIRVSDHKSTPDDVSEVHLVVLHTNHPPLWSADPITLSTNEDVLFTSDLSTYASDIDTGDKLNFTLVSGPSWASLSAAGVLSGTAHMDNEGANNFVVRVNDPSGAAADTHVIVNVLHVNHAPYWTQNPIVLPNAKDDSTYNSSVASYAKDSDPGDTLHFVKISSTPAWVQFSNAGEITGSPSSKEVGLNSFQVKVVDAAGAEALATVQITVEHVNHPPKWAANPIALPNAFTSIVVNQNLSPQTSDPDVGDALTFSLTGPSWGSLDPKTGIFTGTPSKTDLGANSWQATVTDPFGASDTTTLQVNVLKSNEPPIWNNHPTILGDAKEDSSYSAALPNHATDPDSDPLFFTIVKGPLWATIDANGNLSGTPKAGDLGLNKFTISVSDHKSTPDDISEVHIFVEHTNHAPYWVMDPILLETKEDVLFTSDLSPYAKDSDVGDKLSFLLVSGPSWATLSAGGILTGTAHMENEGPNNFVVRVADQSGTTADTHVIVNVLHVNHPPYWTQNPVILENAKDDSPYASTVNAFAKDPDVGDTLHFVKVSTTPSWVKISSTGAVTGAPSSKDAGLNSFQVKVVDDSNAEALVTVQITVDHVNHPPKWAANPLLLPNASTAVAFNQNIGAQASDPDQGDTLTFTLKGPAWATLDSKTGSFKGTPAKLDLGLNSWQATVTDSFGASDTTTVQVTVIKSNEPPVWNNHPTLLGDAKEDSGYSAALSNYASDPDSDALFFTILTGPKWASVGSNGVLSGTPRASDLGLNKFTIKVSDHKSTPDDVSEVQIMVAHTNHAPIWAMDPILFSTYSEKPFTASIAPFATDPDTQDTLSFSVVTGPVWAALSNDGVFTGTPQAADEGQNTFTVQVADNAGATTKVSVIITVLHPNHAPYWTQNPITLPNAKEASAYNFDVSPYAKDPDVGDTLNFSKVTSTPTWITIDSQGKLHGTPSKLDAGPHSFDLQVADASGAKAVATFQITVDKINHPPVWSQDPVTMGLATLESPYTFNLAPFASDPDGDALSFSWVSGPTWMSVAANGSVTGTPLKPEDVGSFTAQFRVTDTHGASATTHGTLVVVNTNHPPIISADLPKFTVKERQIFSVDLKQWVTDPEGDALSFKLSAPLPWTQLAANGNLKLVPQRKDIGNYALDFTVSDGKLSATGKLIIEVVKDPRAPIWLSEPIASLTMKAGQSLNASLSNKAKDYDNLVLSFAKKSGPAWLSFSPVGMLSGTPLDADNGENRFTLTTCNTDNLCADGTLIVTVGHSAPVDDIVQIDAVVPGALAENLWVIDNHQDCSKTITELRRAIPVFYDDLQKAQIHHSGIYLSANAKDFDGEPVHSPSDPMLLLWSQSNIVADFIKRTQMVYTPATERCPTCKNSPIWAMHRFYAQAPDINEIWHNGYFMAKSPMDVMIVSHRTDNYHKFAQAEPETKKWKALDFAKDFSKFHQNNTQPYRISAVARNCPSEDGPYLLDEAGGENSYKVLTDTTRGTFYTDDCHLDMKKTLHDYASKIIFRAYVHAKTHLPLSKLPKDPKQITVSLAGQLLIGNTGSSTDQWSYNANKNEVDLYWNLIDDSQLKPGDKIEIKYWSAARLALN